MSNNIKLYKLQNGKGSAFPCQGITVQTSTETVLYGPGVKVAPQYAEIQFYLIT